MTTTKQAIVDAFTKAFDKHFYNELVIGKLAHSEFKDNVNKGDEVNITMAVVICQQQKLQLSLLAKLN